jgi:hypothetical protein
VFRASTLGFQVCLSFGFWPARLPSLTCPPLASAEALAQAGTAMARLLKYYGEQAGGSFSASRPDTCPPRLARRESSGSPAEVLRRAGRRGSYEIAKITPLVPLILRGRFIIRASEHVCDLGFFGAGTSPAPTMVGKRSGGVHLRLTPKGSGFWIWKLEFV